MRHPDDRLRDLEAEAERVASKLTEIESDIRGVTEWLACQGASTSAALGTVTRVSIDLTVEADAWARDRRSQGARSVTLPDDLLGELQHVIGNVLGNAGRGVHCRVEWK